MGYIYEYYTFRDIGKDSPEPIVDKKIFIHLLYNVKSLIPVITRQGTWMMDTSLIFQSKVYILRFSISGIQLLLLLYELNEIET